MTKEDIIRKLSSRKLWLAIAGFVSGIMLALKVDSETVETVSGLIMSGASIIAYIIAEGLVDSAGATSIEKENTVHYVNESKPPEQGPED